MASPKPPKSIGRYEIRQELGRGMMGVVYEAYDPSLHRAIALKVIHLALAVSPKEQKGFEQRFLAEARIAARLSHPGIVVVHDVGRDEKSGSLFIALERLSGQTLAERTSAERRLEWREALRIVASVARALHYAHAEGVVHRDVKPANIMILPSGDPKVMDFGLAKHLTGHDLTQAGQFVGTPLFMAPEQVLGQPVDGRTDLFSLGSVLYTLLTGKRAFAAESVPRIMARVAHHQPPLPFNVVSDLPIDVDYLVARAMAKSPADRYPSGEAMAEDAEDILSGLTPRHRAGWTLPPRGEGTAVSAGAGDSGLVDLGLEPLEGSAQPSPHRPAVRPLRLLVLAVPLLGVAVFLVALARPQWFAAPFRMLPPPSPAALPPAPAFLATPEAPTPAAAKIGPAGPAEGAPGTELPPPDAKGEPPPDPSPETPAPAPPPSPTPAVTASPIAPGGAPPARKPSPRSSPSSAPRKAPAPPVPGRLAIQVEHHLKAGTVKVFLDGKLVMEETLDSRVTRKILFLEFREGAFQETLPVSPGRHQIGVRVEWEDKKKSRRILGTFKAGVTRRLLVEVGRLSGDLSLEWQP